MSISKEQMTKLLELIDYRCHAISFGKGGLPVLSSDCMQKVKELEKQLLNSTVNTAEIQVTQGDLDEK